MSTYPERARALRGVLDARQAPDGGWPHRLDKKNAATSIPSTAHVIEILRSWNYEFRDRSIQDGLRYLANAVPRHMQGRGRTLRYPAFALWGLTRYPQAPFSKGLEKGFIYSLAMLQRYKLDGGGWPVERGGDFSLTVSMPCVHALDRLAYHPRYGAVAELLRSQARQRVVRERRGAKALPWWTPYGDQGKPSGAATAMAVLTLAGGNNEERALARNGITWLLGNPQEWVDRCETDTNIDNRSWQMLSFSLAMRAVLHPCAKESPSKPILRSAVQHWDDLWVDTAGAWTHIPGDIPTTTGSFGVVVAARALKRSFEFDPATHLQVASRMKRSKRRSHPRPPLSFTLYRSTQCIHIVNQRGDTVVKTKLKGQTQWRCLELIAKRHIEGATSNDQSRQTITLAELAKACENSAEACARAIHRLNSRLSREADKNNNRFLQTLIEDIDPSDGGERGVGFDEVECVVIEDAPS